MTEGASDALRHHCHRHLQSMFEFFQAQSAPYLDMVARRWLRLINGSTWSTTADLAARLRQEAVRNGAVTSARFVADQDHIAVVVSVAPSRGDDHLVKSFPGSDYLESLRAERQLIRSARQDWAELDFAHWMLLWDEEGSDVHLCYLLSLETILEAYAEQLYRGMSVDERGRHKVKVPPAIVPTDLFDVDDWPGAFREMLREEANLRTERGR